jgi:hypothetical protein
MIKLHRLEFIRRELARDKGRRASKYRKPPPKITLPKIGEIKTLTAQCPRA